MQNIHHERWINCLKEGDYVLVDDGNTRYKARFLSRNGDNQCIVNAEYAKVETVENHMLFPYFEFLYKLSRFRANE